MSEIGNYFEPGDAIYYFDEDTSGWPGTVIEVKKRVKIRINHQEGDKTIWVKHTKLELQDSDSTEASRLASDFVTDTRERARGLRASAVFQDDVTKDVLMSTADVLDRAAASVEALDL